MLTSDFKEFAELLNSNGVEYLVVGGYALAAHGHPRYTGDLGITNEDLTAPNQVIQLGDPPGRIDLLTSIDGVHFHDCHARRITISVDGVSLNFISLEDFKANKKAAGRHRDLADLEALEQPPAKNEDQ